MEPNEQPDQGHQALARFSAVRDRLRALDTRRPWLLDGAVTALATAIMVFPPPDETFSTGAAGRPAALPLLVAAALVTPLLWRRRAPERSFVTIIAVIAVGLLLGVRPDTFVVLLVALYAATLYGRPAFLPWAAALALVGMLLTVFPSLPGGFALRIVFVGIAITAAVALGLATRSRNAYLQAMEERAARLEVERDQRAQLAIAEERARISHEMHDVIGHNLAVIIGLADGAAALSRTVPERGTEALTTISGIGRQALTELRGLLGVLQDGTAELAPQPGLTDLDPLFAHLQAAGLPVRFRASGPLDALPIGLQVVLHRIIQESLTNTLKHGGPGTTATVTLAAGADRIHLAINDTGSGGPASPADDGRGLPGIRERAALYGGMATAGPRPGGGWTVTAEFPAPALPASKDRP
ncbi:sensor histidine kinase [Actinomadura sp. 6N118]|uniref:sensor histidine kinase n=1 Tax=Actinomadura sp. 6N118 TaxID=3375151 RepID=UPI0037BE3A77